MFTKLDIYCSYFEYQIFIQHKVQCNQITELKFFNTKQFIKVLNLTKKLL